MRYSELKAHINNALLGETNFAPFYVVFGEDDYLVDLAVKQFEGVLDKDYADFNFSRFDKDVTVDELKDALDTYPMFDSVRIVVLFVDDKLPEATKKFIDEYVKAPSPTSVLVAIAEGDAVKSLTSKKAEKVDCSRLEDEEIVEEIDKLLMEEPPCAMEPAAVNELIRRTQSGMARIVSETLKLKSYAQGKITKADVEEMVVADVEYQAFELADAIASKDGDKALKMLAKFYEDGVKGVTLINKIYDKYRKMFFAKVNKDLKNDELAQALGMKAGAVYYLRKSAENYTPMRLKKCVEYLHSLQYDVLSGKRLEASAAQEAVLQLLAM